MSNVIYACAEDFTKENTGSEIIARPIAGFGWTTFKVSWIYKEEFINVPNNVAKISSYRTVWVSAYSSRPSWQTPFSFEVSDVTHFTPTNSIFKGFFMEIYTLI